MLKGGLVHFGKHLFMACFARNIEVVPFAASMAIFEVSIGSFFYAVRNRKKGNIVKSFIRECKWSFPTNDNGPSLSDQGEVVRGWLTMMVPNYFLPTP